jgi:hypothetical protein
MLMGFCLSEIKNTAVLFSVYSLPHFCQLSTLTALKVACHCYIRVKWMSSNKSYRGKMCDGGGVLRKMRISTIHLSTLGGHSIYHSKGSKSS